MRSCHDIALSKLQLCCDGIYQTNVDGAIAAQTKNLRQQLSGVSLDEEATIVIQFQRAYEANSRLIAVLDQLTEETIQILRR